VQIKTSNLVWVPALVQVLFMVPLPFDREMSVD